jgi:hypothetical protein
MTEVDSLAAAIAEIDRRHIPTERTRLQRQREAPRPRAVTRTACAELADIDSLAELKQTRGYMSAPDRRAFERCEGRR